MASMLYQHLPDVVGVVGAGQMGTGIAQVLAQRGLKVILSDRKFDIIERGLSVIQRSLDKQVGACCMGGGACWQILCGGWLHAAGCH